MPRTAFSQTGASTVVPTSSQATDFIRAIASASAMNVNSSRSIAVTSLSNVKAGGSFAGTFPGGSPRTASIRSRRGGWVSYRSPWPSRIAASTCAVIRPAIRSTPTKRRRPSAIGGMKPALRTGTSSSDQ